MIISLTLGGLAKLALGAMAVGGAGGAGAAAIMNSKPPEEILKNHKKGIMTKNNGVMAKDIVKASPVQSVRVDQPGGSSYVVTKI